jgi:hypothetical protein
MADNWRDTWYGDDGDERAPPPEHGPNQGNRIVDKRRPERINVPFYVVERYGAQLKPLGLAVYLALCFHCSRRRVAYPSYGTIAREIGCSRSTVERQMRLLKDVGLVVVQPRFDGARQTSNIIYLVDPGTRPEDVIEQPPAPQKAPDNGRRPPVNKPAPAPDNSQGGRRPLDGPEVDPKEVIPKEGAQPPPEAAPEPEESAVALTVLWLSVLVCGVPKLREEHRQEFKAEVKELLRRGYTVEHLERCILDPTRDRTEWARVFRARVARARPSKRPRQAPPALSIARTPDDEANAAEAVRRIQGAGGFSALHHKRVNGDALHQVLHGDAFQLPEE